MIEPINTPDEARQSSWRAGSTPKADASIIVNAPRGFVFAQLSNSENYPKIVSSYKSVRPKGKEGEWDVYDVEVHAMGSTITGIQKRRSHPEDWTEDVMESEKATVHSVITFEEVPGGTKVRLQMDMKLKGTLKLLGAFAAGSFGKSVEETGTQVKGYLEAAAPKQ